MILDQGLGSIQLKISNALIFISLKLRIKDWKKIQLVPRGDRDPETDILIEILQKPYKEFYDYNSPWSIGELEKICSKEKLPIPDPDTI